MLTTKFAEQKEPTPLDTKSRKTKWIAFLVAGAVLFGGGIATGMTLPDPTASEAYRALATDRDSMQADFETLKTDNRILTDSIKDREATAAKQVSDAKDAQADVRIAEAAIRDAEAAIKKREAAVKEREDAVTGAENEKAENAIHEGTWTVGVDIAPGTYRTTEAVGSRCYWGIYVSGTNSDDIVANDLPGGGRPTVTLSEGQDFRTTRCGSWDKQ